MRYRDIFREIIEENKLFIRVYLFLALFFSISSFGNLGVGVVFAATTATTLVATSGTFGQFYGSCIESLGLNMEPSLTAAIISIMSILFEKTPDRVFEMLHAPSWLTDFSFGIMNYWPLRILCIVWFVISALPRIFGSIRYFGISLETISEKFGIVMNAIIVMAGVVTRFDTGTTVQAAETIKSGVSTSTGIMISNVLLVIVSFIFLILILVGYVIIRYFMFFLDIISLPLSVIPLFSLGMEIIKTVVVILVLAISIVSPMFVCVVYSLLLILGVVFFKKAYTNVRYFKQIYVKPLFGSIFGHRRKVVAIDPRMPSKLVAHYSNISLKLAIPVYVACKQNDLKLHERWWLILGEDICELAQKSWFHKEIKTYSLICSDENRFFVKKSLRFYEVFHKKYTDDIERNRFEKSKKVDWIVFSRDYDVIYDEIKKVGHLFDYDDTIRYLNERDITIQKERSERRKTEMVNKMQVIKDNIKSKAIFGKKKVSRMETENKSNSDSL